MRISDIDSRLAAIAKECKGLVSESFTDETRAMFDKLEAEARTLREDRARLEHLAQEERSLNAPVNPPVIQPTLEMGDAPEDRRFENFGEALQAIARASGPNPTLDPRLVGMHKRAATGLGEAVPSAGGFLVEKDLVGGVIDRVYDNPIVEMCDQMEIGPGANGIKINAVDESSRADGYRWGGILGYWRAEADSITATKPKFRRVTIDLESVMAVCYSTEEMLEDAVFLNSYVPGQLAKELGHQVAEAVINGDGSGKPLGVANSGALVSVAKESGQIAATIVAQNIAKMWARMYAPSRATSAWLINQDVEPQLHTLTLDAGTAGYPIYLPPGGFSDSPYGRLYGRPVIPVEFCPTLGTTGDIQLVDLKEYALIKKGAVKQATSMHVQFLAAEQVFRASLRVNGQPKWNAALTPKKGTNTLSPFVWLATRS